MAISSLLVVQGLVALVTGALYLYVARLVLAREVSAAAKRANHAFALWWGGFGALQILVGLYQLPAAVGFRDLATVVTLNVILILYAIAVGALVYFLLFLYTGSERVFWPIVSAYLLLAITLLYLVAWMQPTGFEDSARGTLIDTREPTGLPAFAFGLLFSLPVVIAALGYGSLYLRTQGRLSPPWPIGARDRARRVPAAHRRAHLIRKRGGREGRASTRDSFC